MSNNPVVLELASLPREQIGPFLLLGLPKEANKDLIEKHWADRVRWALQNRSKLSREDINWAHEMLKDFTSRVRSDAASLNADTSDGLLVKLARRYGGGQGRMWQPLDSEKPLAEYSPAAELPDLESVRSATVVPELPEELPAVAGLLERLAQAVVDPWTLELPRQGGVASPLPHQDQAP
jgi:hypothetical protein